MSIEYMTRLIKDSSNIVCLLGRAISAQSGCDMYRDSYNYVIEQKYGKPLEEILSAGYYTNRSKDFFEFYRNEILMRRGEPNETHFALRRMEQQGKLRQIITRGIFDLARIAGCTNVTSLHGSIYDNQCPKCGRRYDYTYMMREPLPLCENCGSIVNPSILLRGELVDNMKITQAASYVEQAEILLVVGTTMHSHLTESFLKYFNGSKVILISETASYDDRKADCVCIGSVPDIMSHIG